MWTDFAFNVILLALASDVGGYFYVLAISNVGYIMFNFLNLNAGWIHRIDSAAYGPAVEGADLADRASTRCWPSSTRCSWAPGPRSGAMQNALWSGLVFAALIIPVFWLSPLCAGRRQVPETGDGGSGPERGRSGRAQGGHAALSGAGRWALPWCCGRTGSSSCRPEPALNRRGKGPGFGCPFLHRRAFICRAICFLARKYVALEYCFFARHPARLSAKF